MFTCVIFIEYLNLFDNLKDLRQKFGIQEGGQGLFHSNIDLIFVVRKKRAICEVGLYCLS